MKRFLLFSGEKDEEAGGWGDFTGAYDTLDEALRAAGGPGGKFCWWHVVDTETMNVVAEG